MHVTKPLRIKQAVLNKLTINRVENYTDIKQLLWKYLANKITPDELARLNAWVDESSTNRRYFMELTDPTKLLTDVKKYAEANRNEEEVWHKMEEHINTSGRIVRMKWWRYAAAAAAVLIAVVSIYLLQQNNKPVVAPVIVQHAKQDAQPNSQHAYLTLDNGETIMLDSLQSGLLATQGNTKVTRSVDGVLKYSHEKNTPQSLIYNKVTVPKGGDVVYLQLSEGTKVWLNAESSIRYPVAFSEDERKVEITGEAYFEVIKSQTKKFIVSKGSMNVVVLGTKFNVNTYDNEENIRVTLLEGSVKVQSDNSERTIKPGQQAVLKNANIDVLNNVDVEAIMAWKAGKFVFNNTNIQLIMRQMERWYDLEKTQFDNESVKQLAFNGAISRYNNASKVLELLEEAGSLHFKIQGKKVILSQ